MGQAVSHLGAYGDVPCTWGNRTAQPAPRPGQCCLGRHSEQASSFRLLFVCTGNICRSPFAEILTRHLLRGRLGGRAAAAFDVSSAGVAAVVGSAMHPDPRAELAPWGLDGAIADDFVARQLQSSMIEQSHLVLGVTSRHRSAVVEQCRPRCPLFGLREFARLAAEVDGRAAGDPVARAHAPWSTWCAPPRPGPADPPGRRPGARPDGWRPGGAPRGGDVIQDAVTAIVDVIAPRRVPVR